MLEWLCNYNNAKYLHFLRILFYSIPFEDKQWKCLLVFCKILWLLQIFSQSFHLEIDYEAQFIT